MSPFEQCAQIVEALYRECEDKAESATIASSYTRYNGAVVELGKAITRIRALDTTTATGGAEREAAFRAGYRLASAPDAYRLCEEASWGEWSSRNPAIAQPERDAERVRLTEALRSALDHYERNICEHEDTHRGGSIWTICDSCGMKWADDRGGFVPFRRPTEIEAAYALLQTSAAAEVAK